MMCTWWTHLKEATTRNTGMQRGIVLSKSNQSGDVNAAPSPASTETAAIEQDEPADDEHGNLNKQTEQPVPGENSIPDDLTLDKLMEQKNLHRRLVATA